MSGVTAAASRVSWACPAHDCSPGRVLDNIDRYFIHGCGCDPQRRAVVASIVKLARDLSGLVVAEGAQNQDDLEALATMGVELAQSFLLARPMPTSDFKRALVTLDPNAEEGEIRKCRIEDLSPGMIIQQEVRTPEGALLVSKGQEVTAPLLFKLKNFHARLAITGEVTVSMPTTTLAFIKGAS